MRYTTKWPHKQSKALVFVLLLTLLWTSVAQAQDPQPPNPPTPTDPVITECTTMEWVTVETECGQERVFVPVSSIEAVQTVNIPVPSLQASGASPLGSPTIKMMRGLGWTASGSLHVWAFGSTSASETAEWIYVWIGHYYRPTPGSGSFLGVANNSITKYNTTSTGVRESLSVMFSAGMEHQARGHHQARINDQNYIYNNQYGPQRVIP